MLITLLYECDFTVWLDMRSCSLDMYLGASDIMLLYGVNYCSLVSAPGRYGGE